jgi:hypothetical protein
VDINNDLHNLVLHNNNAFTAMSSSWVCFDLVAAFEEKGWNIRFTFN